MEAVINFAPGGRRKTMGVCLLEILLTVIVLVALVGFVQDVIDFLRP